MSEQYVGDRLHNPYNIDKTDPNTTNPEVNLNSQTGEIMADPSLNHETPVSESPVAAAPLEGMAVQMAPQSAVIPHTASTAMASSAGTLLDPEASEHFRARWNEIQGKFVDEPRTAVEQADGLVSEVVNKITQMFTSEHNSLEGQWNQGSEISTEDLRKALQHYRAFFNRLVL